VDTIWLNMDRPNNLMVVDSLVFFDEPVDWDRLRTVLRERLVWRFPVFRQRPVVPAVPWTAPHWEDDPDFDLERHLNQVRLPAPGDDEALRRYVEDRVSVPLDRRHPLWESTFIDGYRGGAAVFSRFHHAVSDGIASTHVLMSLTDASPAGDLTGTPVDAAASRPAGEGFVGSAWRAAGTARALAGSAAAGAWGFLTGLPRSASPAHLRGPLDQAVRTAGIVNKLVLGHNPPTALDGEPGRAKTAVWSRPLPLREVKQIGRLAGATVNDVLVSALSGAIGTYLADHDGAAADLSTMVPVNLRPMDSLPSDLGNDFALVLLKLPSGVSAPLARLAETKRRMDAIKHSPEAALTMGLINAIGRTGRELERVVVNFFAGKAIGVTTNVPGPTAPRYLAGTKIAGVLAWAPMSGRQTFSACIVTYNGTVRVGFKVDSRAVRHPEALVTAFEEHIDALVRMSRAAGRSTRARTLAPAA
jgi:diacylglycerol O-acyltransferase